MPDLLFSTSTPIPESVNHAYMPVARTGKIVMTKKGRTWKQKQFQHIALEGRVQGWAMPPEAKLKIVVVFHFRDDGKRRDLDDYPKLLLDTIADALGFDDFSLDQTILLRGAPSRRRPRVRFWIYPADPLVPDDDESEPPQEALQALQLALV